MSRYTGAGVLSQFLFLLLSSGVLRGNKLAEIYPRDKYIIAGSTLHMTCTFTEAYLAANGTLDSTFLYFDAHGGEQMPLSRQYPINASTLAFELQNVTSENNGYINCCLNESSIGQDERNRLDRVFIEVGGIPEIEEIDCISHNFEDMRCTFCSLNTEDLQSWLMHYWVEYLQDDISNTCSDNLIDPCTCYLCGQIRDDIPEGVSCDTVEFVKFGNYNINVTVNSDYGMNSELFLVDADPNIVKPDPVQNVMIDELTSTSFNITWSPPDGLSSVTLQYEVNITSEREPLKLHLGSDTWYSASNHTPFSTYDVSIRTRPLSDINGYSGYWSEMEDIKVLTLEDAPMAGPPVPHGSFRTGDYFSNDYYREVTIFWQSIEPPYLKCGEIIYHTVHYETTDGHTGLRSVVVPVTDSNFSTTLSNLLQSHAYVISVTASTKVGPSPAETIYLPSTADMPKVPDVTAEQRADGSILFEWSFTESTRAETFTLWACVGLYKEKHTCDESPKVKYINGTAKSHVVENPSRDEVYSLSVNTASASSGMTHDWICVYEYDAIPGPPVLLSVTQEGRSLKADWMPLHCDFITNRGRVIEYHIYLEDHQKNFYKNASVSAETFSYKFDDLPVSHNYTVYLRATSTAGDGLSSNTISRYIADDSGLEAYELALIVVGCFLSIAIFVGAICLIQKGKVCVEEKMSMPVKTPGKFDDINVDPDTNSYWPTAVTETAVAAKEDENDTRSADALQFVGHSRSSSFDSTGQPREYAYSSSFGNKDKFDFAIASVPLVHGKQEGEEDGPPGVDNIQNAEEDDSPEFENSNNAKRSTLPAAMVASHESGQPHTARLVVKPNNAGHGSGRGLTHKMESPVLHDPVRKEVLPVCPVVTNAARNPSNGSFFTTLRDSGVHSNNGAEYRPAAGTAQNQSDIPGSSSGCSAASSITCYAKVGCKEHVPMFIEPQDGEPAPMDYTEEETD